LSVAFLTVWQIGNPRHLSPLSALQPPLLLEVSTITHAIFGISPSPTLFFDVSLLVAVVGSSASCPLGDFHTHSHGPRSNHFRKFRPRPLQRLFRCVLDTPSLFLVSAWWKLLMAIILVEIDLLSFCFFHSFLAPDSRALVLSETLFVHFGSSSTFTHLGQG